MVPVDSVERVGLRHVIENDDIDAVEKVLEERPDNYNKAITWNRRFNMYLEKMKSGNVFEVADVIRTLQVQENEKKLSTGERRLLGTARQILISEVMLVKNAEQQDIENWLNKFLVKYVGFSDVFYFLAVFNTKIVVKYYIIHII